MRPSLRSLTIALSLAGCATTSHGPAGLARAPGPSAPRESCAVLAGRTSYALDLGEAPERQVLSLSCFDSYTRAPEAADRGYVQLHARFDDRHFDALTAALMVVACAGDGACRADGEPESLGQMAYYARALDLARVQKTLRTMVLATEVEHAFLARVEASRDLVLSEAGMLDLRRARLYVEVPAQVRARNQAHAKTYDAYFRRLDDLLPRLDPALKQEGTPERQLQQLVTETTRLRDDYLARCAAHKTHAALECLTGPIARPLTQRLVQLGIRLSDSVLAETEHVVLGLGLDASTTAAQIAAAQTAAIEEEQSQHERWAQAKEEGVDEPTLAAAYGSPAPADVPELFWKAPHDLVGLRAQLRALQPTVDVVRGTVRFVRPRGEQLEISFEDEQPGAACSERAAGDVPGELDDCALESTRPTPVARVYLAVRDAKPILIGNRLEAVIDRESRKGLAVKVFKSRDAEQLVQLRAVRWRP